ncbi:AAA family ATPase [Blastococcus sp. SYSU DS0552]
MAYTEPQAGDDDEIRDYRRALREWLDALHEKSRAAAYEAEFEVEKRKQKLLIAAKREAQREVDEEEHHRLAASGEDATRAQLGGDAILDEPESPPAVWGADQRIAWAKGQGIMLASHQGLGKTTIAQQLVLHRVGVLPGRFLGMPVATDDRPVLYLAMDRPSQALQSFRRMVSADQRDQLNRSLIVWRGPLPVNITSGTAALADFVQEVCPGCGLLVVDSVKDLVPGISKDEVGSALNIAWQEVIARDTELLLLHHQRKAAQGEKRLNALDDVYGSTWLTSGLGSVFALDGEPGSPTVTLKHLKPVIEPIGPLTLRHDHAAGRTATYDGSVTVMSVLFERGDQGATASGLAGAVLGRAAASDLQAIRRQLRQLAGNQLVRKEPGAKTSGGSVEDRWFLTDEGKWSMEIGGGHDD